MCEDRFCYYGGGERGGRADGDVKGSGVEMSGDEGEEEEGGRGGEKGEKVRRGRKGGERRGGGVKGSGVGMRGVKKVGEKREVVRGEGEGEVERVEE